MEITKDGAFEIARRSRGTPRIANRILKRVRDYSEVMAEGVIDEKWRISLWVKWKSISWDLTVSTEN